MRFGVMPPIARLNREQAMYYFLSGYTAKLAGTERGVTEPSLSSPPASVRLFLPLPPMIYAHMLGEKIREHDSDVWLVNTGWTGGPYGVGHRMSIAYTRAMVTAALDGSLAKVETRPDPIFGIQVPISCPGVPAKYYGKTRGPDTLTLIREPPRPRSTLPGGASPSSRTSKPAEVRKRAQSLIVRGVNKTTLM